MYGLISWLKNLTEEKSLYLLVLLINSSFIAMFEFYSDMKVCVNKQKKSTFCLEKTLNMCQL